MRIFRKSNANPTLLGTKKIVDAVKSRVQHEKHVKDARDYHKIYNKWRDYDFLSTICATFGLLLGICNYEYGVINFKETPDPQKYPDPMMEPRNNNWVNHLIRFLILLTSI